MSEDPEDQLVQDYFDENGELVRQAGEIDTKTQEEGVKDDKAYMHNDVRRVNRFRSIAKIHRRDGSGTEKLKDDEISDVLDWTKPDVGATYHLVPDLKHGNYVPVDGDSKLWKPVHGRGPTLERVGGRNGVDYSFKVRGAPKEEEEDI
ncbi:MAG: hypothetical protein Q9195_001019 [Heterodermia aff. obscurata]